MLEETAEAIAWSQTPFVSGIRRRTVLQRRRDCAGRVSSRSTGTLPSPSEFPLCLSGVAASSAIFAALALLNTSTISHPCPQAHLRSIEPRTTDAVLHHRCRRRFMSDLHTRPLAALLSLVDAYRDCEGAQAWRRFASRLAKRLRYD